MSQSGPSAPLDGGRVELEQRIRGAADMLCRYEFECWRYGDSIGFEGLIDGTRLTGDGRYLGFAYGAVKSWIPRAQPYTFWDNTAPGHAMCLVYEAFEDEAVLTAAVDLAAYLRSRRLCRGVFVAFEKTPLHPPFGGEPLGGEAQALLADPGAGVFVDCLHFDPPFFTHLGQITESRDLVDEGIRQACAAIDVLQDSDTGLFAHFYLERTQQVYGVGWSRGQGWAMLGLLDVLEYAPAEFPERGRIVTALRDLCATLADTQDVSGHWRGRIVDRDTPLETSAAFFFAAGIWRGIRLGVLDGELASTADEAWAAGLSCVAANGAIEGVSAEVWPSPADSHYRWVPTRPAVTWGLGPFLLAARERPT
jgi:unsaturated rhamnogalacturonyl hydrolase